MGLKELIKTIRSQADPVRAKNLSWYFKTGPGEYGAGDKFLGLTTPQIRQFSRQYKHLPLADLQKLIRSEYHEERSVAIQILVSQFSQKPEVIYNFYLKNTKHVNNWDLVDISAPKIVGAYLSDKPRDLLYQLAKSPSLWERRIAIISCFYFINQKDFSDALKISLILLSDEHDLIHKAVGWALREIGKRDESVLINFLKTNYSQLPRTTLRYAIEKFSEPKRQKFLRGEI